MKRIFVLLFAAALLLTGCGVGSQTVVSGRPDEAGVVFFADRSYTVEVTVDQNTYQVSTVKDSEFKSKRSIKETVANTIYVTPGTHDVTVKSRGQVVLNQKIFVSAGDTKVIRL